MPRYPYALQYNPPAPVLPARVGPPGGAPLVMVAAFVDTGADVSVLPRGLPEQLNLPRVGRTVVAGFDGLNRILPVYSAEIGVNGFSSVVETIGFGATTLIGRDFLNRFVAHLHGPEGVLALELPDSFG